MNFVPPKKGTVPSRSSRRPPAAAATLFVVVSEPSRQVPVIPYMSRSGAPPPLKRHFLLCVPCTSASLLLARRGRQFSRYEYRPVCRPPGSLFFLFVVCRVSAATPSRGHPRVYVLVPNRLCSCVAPSDVLTICIVSTVSVAIHHHPISSVARPIFAVRIEPRSLVSTCFSPVRLTQCEPWLVHLVPICCYFVIRPTIAVPLEFRSPTHSRVFPSARPTSCERVSPQP